MAKKKNEDDTKYLDWCEELKDWQEADSDMRDKARQADDFVLKPDGQWEDRVAKALDAQHRPRYTFDKVTPVIETMMADMEDMEFGCNVKPSGNGADKDIAETYEGMIRSILAMSRADATFRNSIRRVMRRGFDAWMIKSKYKDEWSFEQDLFVVPIVNALNRVWVAPTCANEDSSDTPAAYVLTSLSVAEYERKFPEGRKISVEVYDSSDADDGYQPEVITVAERYYQKEGYVQLAQLSNGKVTEITDEFLAIKDEMAKNGVTVVKEKKAKDYKWVYQAFDGGGLLGGEKETNFISCPVITVYGNYEHTGENSKISYSGIVEKAMDAQRVHNYAKSREIEEGALAPRAKWWLTATQAAGHEEQLANMNVSADPAQIYNVDPKAPTPPFYGGGPQVNQHLALIGQQMDSDIKAQANVFDSMQGNSAARMAEETVRMQIDRGTAATRKWVNAIVNGIRQTCEVLVETIPRTYDTKRQFMVMNMDGTEEMVSLNEEVFDQQSGRMIKFNDLNQGKYKVVCEAGPAFNNRLEAGLKSLLEYAAIDPSIVAQGGDIMLRSIDAPLIDQIAERKREQMLQQGLIPPSQMTDEEIQQMQQRMQNKKPSPEQQLAESEGKARLMEGQAAIMNEQNDAYKLQIDKQKADNQTAEVQIKAAEAGVKIQKVNTEIEGNKIDNVQKVFNQK